MRTGRSALPTAFFMGRHIRQNVGWVVYRRVYQLLFTGPWGANQSVNSRLLTTSFDAYRLAYRALRTSGSMACSSCASCRPPAHDGGQVVQAPVQALRALTRADSCLPGGLGWGRESKAARAWAITKVSEFVVRHHAPELGYLCGRGRDG